MKFEELDDDKARQRRFEVVKSLWAGVAIQKQGMVDYRQVAEITGRTEKEISDDIKILNSAGYSKTVYVPEANMRCAALTPSAFQAMDRNPKPSTYDEFVERVNNPQKDFGEPIKITAKSSWDKFKESYHGVWRIITPIVGFVAAVIAIWNFFFK